MKSGSDFQITLLNNMYKLEIGKGERMRKREVDNNLRSYFLGTIDLTVQKRLT